MKMQQFKPEPWNNKTRCMKIKLIVAQFAQALCQ